MRMEPSVNTSRMSRSLVSFPDPLIWGCDLVLPVPVVIRTLHSLPSTSATNRREWGVELQKVLSRDEPYELLTAEQLVGICLYVFIRPKLIPYVRSVGWGYDVMMMSS